MICQIYIKDFSNIIRKVGKKIISHEQSYASKNGYKQGRENEKRKIITNLLKTELSLEEIASITSATKEEIEEICRSFIKTKAKKELV